MHPDILTSKQAAEFLGITYSCLCNRLRDGRGPKRFGDTYHPRFRRSDLEAYKSSYTYQYGGGFTPRPRSDVAFTIRVDFGLHSRLVAAAKLNKRTLTGQVEFLLEQVI